MFKLSFEEESCTAILCNHGCNWNCSICSYKLREGVLPKRFLSVDEILEKLGSFSVERVVLLGGEPTTYPDLGTVVRYAKEDLRAKVRIAHSNASILPPEGVDEMGVSLRAITKRKHQQLTGVPNNKVLANIFKLHDRGIMLQLSTILIPEVISMDEMEKISEYVASVDDSIPFHITGYIPVPGIPWRRPTSEEMREAVQVARRHLRQVSGASLSIRDYLATSEHDSLHRRTEVP